MARDLFIAEHERVEGCTHILLIATGSVASIKLPLIVSELISVRVFFSHTTVTRLNTNYVMRAVQACESGGCCHKALYSIFRRPRGRTYWGQGLARRG